MLKTIPTSKLCLGMYLHKLGGSWTQHPFWKTSFLIDDKGSIEAILKSGITDVIIDTSKGRDVAVKQQSVDTAKDSPRIQTPVKPDKKEPVIISMEAEWRQAQKICFKAKEAVASMFSEARMGKSIDVEKIEPLIEEISGSLLRNPEALISVARLKTSDDYTFLHSVAVSAMMIALARELGLNEVRIQQAGLGGLLHDVGKALMPIEVLNKPGKLTDAEYSLIKTHAAAGHKLLVEQGSVDLRTLDVVLHHHEKFDGSGYPDKLVGRKISLLARMGAVCDVYDAITSHRPYKRGWEPAISIKRMRSWEGHFDPAVYTAFVKTLGIYPAGSLVKLTSGKLGVVLQQTPDSILKPRIKVFFSTKPKGAITIYELDLSAARCDESIVSVENPLEWGFKNFDELWRPF